MEKSTGSFSYGLTLSDVLEQLKEENLVIITDQNIFEIYKHEIGQYKSILIPESESAKDMSHILDVTRKLNEMGCGRECYLLAFGGGAITDFTGFLASIYKRGVRFGSFPSTLLAQVDASIGNKNGVNVGGLKNQLGTFYTPDLINISPKYSLTQENDSWVDGFAEIIKHAVISDGNFFDWIEENIEALKAKELNSLDKCVEWAVAIKLDIVKKDPREKGIRKRLNFGHTIGHAIESVHGLSHGKSVALGMIAELKISEKLGGIRIEEIKRIEKILGDFGLLPSLDIHIDGLWKKVLGDKKRHQESIDISLVKHIGHAEVLRITLEDYKRLWQATN